MHFSKTALPLDNYHSYITEVIGLVAKTDRQTLPQLSMKIVVKHRVEFCPSMSCSGRTVATCCSNCAKVCVCVCVCPAVMRKMSAAF